ncbi:MAG: HIT family protein [Alphaproteobacteria bacterium]
MFILNQKLKNDTIYIDSLELSELLLMNNSYYHWLILVPRVNEVSEIIDLSAAQQTLFFEEIKRVSQMLKSLYPLGKLNIAAIGNIVSQLHMHVILRNSDDITWPDVVWGPKKPVKVYSNIQINFLINSYKEKLRLS